MEYLERNAENSSISGMTNRLRLVRNVYDYFYIASVLIDGKLQITDVARGLAHLHSLDYEDGRTLKMVHGDVKPVGIGVIVTGLTELIIVLKHRKTS